jgi:hypothetical protein
MAQSSKAWDQVGERFVALGTQMRKRADQMSKGATVDRAAFERSVRDMYAALEDGFGLAGKAVRDPKIRRELSNVAQSVREALSATVESAGEQARERLPRAALKRSPKAAGRKAVAPKPTARKSPAAKKAGPASKTTAGRSTGRKRSAS